MKTYPFEGKQYVESGEVRVPKVGEVYAWTNGRAYRSTGGGCVVPILTAPSPRVLTSYVPDAKAGDVYERKTDNGWSACTLWTLTEFREPEVREPFIGFSSGSEWGYVERTLNVELDDGPRWIVSPYSPPVEREAEKPPAAAMFDTLTLIANRADSLKETLLAKHQDYGGSVFKRPRFVPRATAREAMLIRLGDKCERLEQLLAGNKPLVNETEDQTLLDVAGYALLLLTERDLCPTN